MKSEFREHAKRLIARKGQTAVSYAYLLGDALLLATPPLRAGFAQKLMDMQPFWHGVVASYGSRPLPVLFSVLLLASSYRIAKSFSQGSAGYVGAGTAFAIDYALHGEPLAALGMVPTIAGGVLGAFYAPLEKRYGSHANKWVRALAGSPKRVQGALFFSTSAAECVSAIMEHDYPLLATAALWSAGGVVNVLLPRDNESLIKRKDIPASFQPSAPAARAPSIRSDALHNS